MSSRHQPWVKPAALLAAVVVAGSALGVGACATAEPLTLDEAIARALAGSPLLTAEALKTDAARARADQAGKPPNPEVAVELEDFGGPGALRELESAQLTVQLAQRLELGGKRGKLKRTETLAAESASHNLDWQRRMLAREVTVRFSAVLAAQENRALQAEIVDLQRQVTAAVTKRVAAGKDPPLEETRAQVELAEADLDLRSAERDLALARASLAATWGDQEADFSEAVPSDSAIAPPADREALSTHLDANPLLSRWASEEERGRAELSLAKALRVPDLTLFGGVRHYYESEERAVVAGLSVPLPLFDRNQGGIREAHLRASAAAAERQAVETELRLELDRVHARLTDADAAVNALKQQIVPAATRTFESALTGYRSGKYDYLLVLDAQRTLFKARAREIQAREVYRQAWADLRLLIGPSPEAPGTVE